MLAVFEANSDKQNDQQEAKSVASDHIPNTAAACIAV